MRRWRLGLLSTFLLATFLLVTARARAEDAPPRSIGASPIVTVGPTPTASRPDPLPEQAVDLRGAWRLRALLTRAGLPLAAQGFAETLSPAEAQRILNALVRIRPTLGTFGPRQVALRLLGEVTASPGGITLRGLEERLRRFEPLVIVRPDGYLADVLDGKAIARAGRIHLDDRAGMLRAGALDVGAFYFRRLGNLYRIDDKLDPVGDILIELPLQHGLGAVDDVLDGAEGSLENTVWGIAELIREPIRSVEALAHLPQAVVALIENSPEYWARFVAMPPSDQVREVSRLVTDLALLCGGVQGVAAGAKAAGQLGKVGFPALRLTGSGEVVVATASVAVGKPILVLTGAAGGFFVLQMAQAGGGPPQSGSAAVEQPAQSPDGEAEAAAEDEHSSRALARALKAAGHVCPPEWAAHHIVAGRAKPADRARQVLKRFGIGIDDAPNGVFLPANEKSPNPTGVAVHSTLHRQEYYNTVNNILEQARNRAEVENFLARIRQRLLSGGL